MPHFILITLIHAPIKRVFDISRSIDLHMASLEHTNERAVAGKTSGLIEENETVTWQAKHLFRTRFLTTVIVSMKPHSFFQDDMLQGDFKMMKHEHHFEESNGTTTMRDVFYFESPFGIVGRIFNAIYLTRYMKRLIQTRNSIIKQYAESDKWKTVLYV